ncbi:MAG TPA: hypothetical protein PKL92_04720 [Aquaticitalea sp.]|nr:hypothetical protein [Aquaticitalea sp.]
MADKFFTVKTLSLNNHCPECYSNSGLQLTFKQRFVENAFYRAISSEVKHHMVCDNCKTEIFPVRWTDEIERVFDYHQRAFVPRPTSVRFKKLTWVLLIVLIIIVLLLNLYIFNR